MYYVCWMEMLYGGIKGLQFFNAENKVWGQAHIWASWVIFSAVKQGDPDLIKFNFSTNPDGTETFTVTFDRKRLRTSGFEALSKFLHKLHVYNSIGDFEAAEKFFNHYSQVDEEMLKVRAIVIANKKPRRLELQPNLLKQVGSLEITYKDYADTFSGVVESYVERWPEAFLADVYNEWSKNAD